jgi:hypothetical protein
MAGSGMPYATARTDGLAIASLITGILSLVCCFAVLGIVLGPIAAIMGFISRGRISSSGGMLGGGGLAIGGLILGIAGFVASIGALIFWIAASHASTST